MKYLVNGVEYETLAEAEAAEKKLAEEATKKNELAAARKADVESVKDAAYKYLELVKENDEKRAELKKAENDLYDEYKKLLDNFAEKYNGYHLTVSAIDGKTPEIQVEVVKTKTVEEQMQELRERSRKLFNSFWYI